jgi:hypothetical protein
VSHLRLVPDSPPAPAPEMPRAYAPPPAPARLPSTAFHSHERRLAPSRSEPDKPVPPPGGRAHVTCCLDDLDFEQGFIIALERLARGREMTDELGHTVDRYDVARFAGLRAAGLSGLQARLRPHLRRDHPWQAQARDLVDRLAVEEAFWWGLSGRRL